MSAKIKDFTKNIMLILSGYMIVWGAYNCITCDIDYRPLPVLIIGLAIYAMIKEGEYVSSTRTRG